LLCSVKSRNTAAACRAHTVDLGESRRRLRIANACTSPDSASSRTSSARPAPPSPPDAMRHAPAARVQNQIKQKKRCGVVVTKLGRSLNVLRLLETEPPPELACVHACKLFRRERPLRVGDLVLLLLGSCTCGCARDSLTSQHPEAGACPRIDVKRGRGAQATRPWTNAGSWHQPAVLEPANANAKITRDRDLRTSVI
jgi:hypothetical protein